MALPKMVWRQSDFTAGQITESAARRDDVKLMRHGLKRASNVRSLNTGPLENRAGRLALYPEEGRTSEVKMSTDAIYTLCFAPTVLKVRNSNGVVVLTETGMPWGNDTIGDIVWDLIGRDIVICFPDMQPKIARWDGATTWEVIDYEETVTGGGKKLTIFSRISPKGITLTPSDTAGNINVVFSDDVLVSGLIGTRLSYIGRQMTITGVTNPTTGTATVNEPLMDGVSLPFGLDPSGGYAIGDVVVGGTSGATAQVISFPGGNAMIVQLLSGTRFVASEMISGPSFSFVLSGTPTLIDPQAVAVWTEEVMNNHRGWPASCFVDRNRLGFCDFPAIPDGIAWSAISSPADLLVGPDADNAIFETVQGVSRVYHVVGGADQFVFTDRGIRYIPISAASPLQPGSVEFREIPFGPVARVRPVRSAEGLIFLNEGLTSIIAIVATGQTAAPWLARDVSQFHSDLIISPKALAFATADGNRAENYLYVLNSDGTVAVGRYDQTNQWVGFVPHVSTGLVKWVSARGSSVLFNVAYDLGATTQWMVEQLDGDQYLDGAVVLNDPDTELEGDPGDGPLWFYAGLTVDLMLDRRYLGSRVVDDDGEIVEETDDDFSNADIVAGLAWTVQVEPWIPNQDEGDTRGQRMRRRKVARAVATVQDSTAFTLLGRIFADEINDVGVPQLISDTFTARGLGRSFDPSVPLEKTVPGPLRIVELSGEVTV